MLLASQTAIEIRDRLRNPPNAVFDAGITMRNGRPVPRFVPALVTFHPPPVDTRETFLARDRHVGLAILRGQRARVIPRDLPRGVSLARIMVEAAAEFHVTVEDILSDRRTQKIVIPRQVVAYLARHMTILSMPGIGRRIGNRDHTTILHAVRRTSRLIDADQAFAQRVYEVRRRVLEDSEI